MLSDADQLVVRDENLAKLLFADQFGPDAVLALLRRRRAEFIELRQSLLAITPGRSRALLDEETGRPGPGWRTATERTGLNRASTARDAAGE